MLKFVMCVACEKVIFSNETLNASLINLFTKMRISIPEEAPDIPPNAVVPKEWAVFSSWDTEPGDELKQYFLCVQTFYPDKTPSGAIARSRINIERGKRAQINTQILGFPIGQSGAYTVRTWIEEGQAVVNEPIEIQVELEIARGHDA
jgi:hypothetical protein